MLFWRGSAEQIFSINSGVNSGVVGAARATPEFEGSEKGQRLMPAYLHYENKFTKLVSFGFN